ncbi:MAG TPA: integrase family protein [Casimicrobium huifangae]|nr:integrase family protein [Casimicrobium huifangae]
MNIAMITKKGALTTRAITALPRGKWLADPGARGAGRLQVIKLSNGGVAWYFRYTRSDGKRDALPLGTDLSLSDARAMAAQLTRRYQCGERDLRDALEAEQRAAERERHELEAAEALEKQKASATLGVLCTSYSDQLKRSGKESAAAVRKALIRHVETPWPELWAKPASLVETDDLLPVVARLVHEGKLREAAKLRSYLRAAYSSAIAARHDPSALPALRQLKLSSNPARDLATIEGNTAPGDRHLSLDELRCYWRRINESGFYYGPLLRFHLLTGAQRITQLSRATTADFDPDTKVIHLYDKKGRRKKPREHPVPLIADALAAMREMGAGPYIFTITQGRTAAGISGIGDALDAVNEAMSAANELPGGRFTARDLRRTVETRLSAVGVSMEDRAHLQSHGLSGIQSRHYDMHKRIEEARTALVKLRGLLDHPGKVIPFRNRKSRNT